MQYTIRLNDTHGDWYYCGDDEWYQRPRYAEWYTWQEAMSVLTTVRRRLEPQQCAHLLAATDEQVTKYWHDVNCEHKDYSPCCAWHEANG